MNDYCIIIIVETSHISRKRGSLREKSRDEEVVTAKANVNGHSIIADRHCHLHCVEQVTIIPIFFWQRFRNAFMIVSHIWSAQPIFGCSPRAKVRYFNSVYIC